MRAVVVAASLVLSLSACSKRGPECDAIVKIINPAVEKLGRVGAAKVDRAQEHLKAMAEVAEITEGAAADLAKLPLTVPELKKTSADYQAMARDAAAAARAVGEAVKSTEASVTTAERLSKELEAAAEALAKACADPSNGGAATCKAFGEAMARYPEDPSGKPAEAAKVVAELETLSFPSKPLLGTGTSVIRLIKANLEVVTALKREEQKATAAEKQYEEASARETPIVDALNAFCAR
jgi:hypothetical protein